MPLISPKQPSIILPNLIIPVSELNADPYKQVAELPPPPELVFNDYPGGSTEKESVEVPLEHIKTLGFYMFGPYMFKSIEEANLTLSLARITGMVLFRYLNWGYKILFFNPKENTYTQYHPKPCEADSMRADLGLPLRLAGRLADELLWFAPTINVRTKADVAATILMMFIDIAYKKTQGEHLILKKPPKLNRTIHPLPAHALS